MQQRCEVCENFRPEGDLKPGRKLEEVTFGTRRVLLCRAHAGIAHNSGVTTFEELRELYVVAARARGVSRSRAIVRHAFRNSLIPIVTIIGLQFGAVLTGTIITETIFAWPGVGRLLIQAINFRDYPLVQGCILFISFTYVMMNLLTDLTYGVLDPRIRLG